MQQRLRDSSGQALTEFALVSPFILLIAFGVIEFGYVLLDQHAVSKMTREGSNLISRSTSIEDAVTALRTMSTRPVNFSDGSMVIFSVIRNNPSPGPNRDANILYQRYVYGSVPGGGTSVLRTSGNGSFRGAPDYEAVNADTDTRLRLVSLPSNIVMSSGAMVYVTEIYSRHTLLTPLDRLGVPLPEKLYSIAYF